MPAADTERFRLRRFIERLVQLGECEIHDKPIDLVDVAAVLEGNPRATWFKSVGPEKAELIGNVKRLLWTGKAVFGGRARERLEGQQAPMLEIPDRLESDAHVAFS